MWQVFIKVRQPGGWFKTTPAYSVGLQGRDELVFEDKKEADQKCIDIRRAINYLCNAGAKTGADAFVKEV